MSRPLVCAFVLLMAASAHAAVLVTPGPPPDPQNYIHLSIEWSFTPPLVVRNSGTGEITNNSLQLINDSLWFPRNVNQANPLLEFVLDPPGIGNEAFATMLGPELNSGLPEFNLHVGEVLSSETVGNNQFSTVRRLTFTAPGGYFRQTPEPTALALFASAATALGVIRRRDANEVKTALA